MSFDKTAQEDRDRKEPPRKFGSVKTLSGGRDDVWVETLVKSCYGADVPDAVSFHAKEIMLLRALGAEHTLITLERGDEFVIALPHAQLTQKIYNADADVVDLKPYATTETKDEACRRLRSAFKEAQERKPYEIYERLTYKAYVRMPQTNAFKEFEFNGKDIDFSQMSEGGSKMGGSCVTLHTRLEEGSPFGTQSFIIETTLSDFKKFVTAATERSEDVLDIRSYSMRKGTVFASKEARP